jgi:carbamoyltransferase
MYILGIWDGHDAGAALVEDNKVIFAANEERFTKRKLEVNFPKHSIEAALRYAKIKPDDIEHIAFSTTEFAKTIERMFPKMRENYYIFRRRKRLKPRFSDLRHMLKYSITSIGITPGSTTINKHMLGKELRNMGFGKFKLYAVEHHAAHAATAAFTSPFKKALIITSDGLGDGLSGSISIMEKNTLTRKSVTKASDSLGIFFEQATNIIGMRELEDEGKVMAMADYSYPFSMDENLFRDFFSVDGISIKAKYNTIKQFEMLQRISWQLPREQFAYMVQQLLTEMLTKFVDNAIERFGIGDVAFSGGIFSNVKANMSLRKLDSLKHWYIFPHMGDGGIALGAALHTNYILNGITKHDFTAYLGPAYGENETIAALKRHKMKFQLERKEQSKHAAELVTDGHYIFWFQDRMEYGPRALGDRSILARSDSEEIKDMLNLYVKKREWFQPFAPSIMEEEAERLLEYDNKGKDKFMTMAYMVKKEKRNVTKSVMHIDGSARAQMVGRENPLYYDVIKQVKNISGNGIVLNTSFNVHGFPIVMDPNDAIMTMKKTNSKYMFINGFFVTNK